VNHSESIVKLAGALSKAQGSIKGAKKDSVNPHFKAAYADLESTWEACREPLSKNGLSVIQFPYSRDGRTGIETMLLHDSGEWIRGEIDVRMTLDTNPQVAGSIITYLRRYSLQGAVGIAPADDDANAASPKPAQKTPDVAPQSTQTPTVTIGTVQIPLVPPAVSEEKKDDATLRHEIQELAAILSQSYPQQYPTVVSAIQFATAYPLKDGSGEGSFKDVLKLKKWQLEKAIDKLNARLNAIPPPTDDDVIPEDDIKY
jgi:hypothetical protein